MEEKKQHILKKRSRVLFGAGTHHSTVTPGTSPVIQRSSRWVPVCCGTLSGIATAGLFNPVDRALYLSVINLKPFLHRDNWLRPFQGASNALLHRTISGGLYFAAYDLLQSPVQQWALRRPLRHDDKTYDVLVTSFVTGTLAGFVNGVILNPIAAVKYAAWGSDTSKGLQGFAVSLWQKGGIRPFINGIVPTVCRDMVFGGAYATLRFVFALELSRMLTSGDYPRAKDQGSAIAPVSQFAAAAIATTLSSPINYWRNMQFDTRVGSKPVGMVQCMRELQHAMAEQPDVRHRIRQIGLKLRVGWGTVRVATGMAVGQQLYDGLSRRMNNTRTVGEVEE
jgi:hypothetical protein